MTRTFGIGAYDWWKARRAARAGNTPGPVIRDGMPEPGFYEKREIKDGPYYPVAYYVDWETGPDVLCCVTKHGNGDFELLDPVRTWSWCADKDVSEEDFRFYCGYGEDAEPPAGLSEEELRFFRYGHGHWPEMPETAAAPGSNFPADPVEALIAEASGKIENAKRWLKEHPKGAADETQAGYARNLQAMLQRLKATADPLHKTEKQPWLDGGRGVDDKFRFREELTALGTRLEREGWAPFVRAEDARKLREAEAERKRRAEEAEKLRQEQEAARRELEANDPVLAFITPEEPIPEPEPVTVEKTRIGGGFGKRASVSRSYTVRIREPLKVCAYFERDPRLLQLLQKLADETAKKLKENTKIPGTVVVDDLGAIISDGTSKQDAA